MIVQKKEQGAKTGTQAMEVPWERIKFPAPERLSPGKKPRNLKQKLATSQKCQKARERTGVTTDQKPTRLTGRC